MSILQRYLTVRLFWTTLLVLAVLVALFSFFSLIDQLEETGKGRYGVPQAVSYVLLTMPRLAYELFPIAAVVGAMATLGMLTQSNELAVIAASGVSRLQFSLLMIKAGLVLVIFAVVTGELVAPASEEKAQHLRSVSMTQQITLKTKFGFWARDADSFINIRKILPGNRVEQIYIYEFDAEDRLRTSSFAQRARYVDRQWLLENIRQSVIGENGVTGRSMPRATWESLLDPEMLNLVIVQPQYLTVWGLFRYINFMRQNNQNTLAYEQALWSKLVRPITIITMIVLAVPLVRGHSRTVALGQRVFVGALIGVSFHLVNEAAEQMATVYQLLPALMATLPTAALMCAIAVLMRRA